jgi:hypothetical protein
MRVNYIHVVLPQGLYAYVGGMTHIYLTFVYETCFPTYDGCQQE